MMWHLILLIMLARFSSGFHQASTSRLRLVMRLADRPGGQQEQSLLPHRLVSLAKRKIIPALLGVGVMLSSGLSTTSPADALSSGSSYGGSSFRSSSPSYSRPSSSYSYHSYSTPSYRPTYTNINTNTYYTRPHSHTHTHKNGDPLTEKEEEERESEVSGFILFLYLATVSALIGYCVDGVKPFGVSVVKIQLAVRTDWLDSSGPMQSLSKECAKKGFAAGNGSPTRRELGKLSWSILYDMGRFDGEWKAASLEGNHTLRPFPGWASKVGERRFAALVAAERAKFETCNPRNPPPLPVTPGDPASELFRRVEGFVSATNAWGKPSSFRCNPRWPW